jgi:hypothetical protein
MAAIDGHLRDLGPVSRDVTEPLIAKLLANEELWGADRTCFSTAIPGAQHIVLKFPDRYPNSHTPASFRSNWSDWKPLLAPIIDDLITRLGIGVCDTSKILFTRLNAGHHIPTHVDENPSSRIPHKIHLPLITNPGVIFRIDGAPYHLAAGSAYELNNLLPHSVHNESDTARVHLIFDCYPVNARS